MSRLLALAIIVCYSLTSAAQTPGDVGTVNLTAWFKPDALADGNVMSWTTAYPIGAGAVQVADNTFPYPQATETPAGEVSNYNKTIELLNNSFAQLKALQFAGNLNLLNNTTTGAEGTFFSAYYLPATTQNGHMMLYNESGTDAIQFRNLGANGRLALGKNMFISVNASDDWAEDFEPNIISYRGNRTGANTMNSFERSKEFSIGGASQSSGPAGIYFGMKPNTATSAYEGYLHEFIFFNRDLTDLEMSKVHTYLALKYGATLDNNGGGIQGDYVATSDAVIWDADESPEFHNDVIGLGRDDSEALLQKQSHAFDDSYRLYLSNLETTNSGNAGVFTNDISYIITGHNDEDLCGTDQEIPAEIAPAVRLQREWKVVRTNSTEEFSLDITLNSCQDLTDLDLEQMRLLVDTDSDFSDAQVFGLDSGLDFTLNGSTITVSGISDTQIPNNTTRFLTLAVVVPQIIITGLDEICSGIDVELTFELANLTEPASFELFDGVNTIAVDNISSGESIIVAPESTTTYSVVTNEQTVFCCGAQSTSGSEDHTILVSAGLEVDLGPDFTICQGETAVLDAGIEDATYIWNSAPGGQELEVSMAGEYLVEVSSDGGCEGSDSVILSVEAQPNGGLDGSISLCNSMDEYDLNILLSGGTDADGVWEEVTSILPGANFNDGTILLDDGISGNLTFNYVSTGVFCESDSSQFSVGISDQPYAGENVLIEICSSDPSINLNNLLAPGVDPGSWEEVSPVLSDQFVSGTGTFLPTGLETANYLFSYQTNLVDPCPAASSLITIDLTQSPSPDFSASIEEGCVPLTVAFTNNTAQNDACTWNFGDGTTEFSCNNITHTYSAVGCFDVFLEVSLNGCVSTLEFPDLVCSYPVPQASFYYSPQALFSDNPLVVFDNLSEGATEYDWSFGDEASSTEFNPVHQYPIGVSDIYLVELSVENEYGCTDSHLETVIVADAISVYVPNAFTPDFDGYNDVFMPVIGAGFDTGTYNFKVFNRWGLLVFESTDHTEGWYSAYDKALVQDGVYSWTLSFKSLYSGLIYERQGQVTVLR